MGIPTAANSIDETILEISMSEAVFTPAVARKLREVI
jgi:hypothetical protein